MENEKKEKLDDGPPFFKKWSGLYIFILVVELILILFFIWITNTFQG